MRKNQAAQDFLALIPGLSTQIHKLSTVIHKDVEKVVNEEGEKILDSSRASVYVATSGVDERSVELTGKSPKVIELKW